MLASRFKASDNNPYTNAGHEPFAAEWIDNKGNVMQAEELPPGADSLSGDPEPWESWETSLVMWSIGIGIAGLFVLGWLVDRFILS